MGGAISKGFDELTGGSQRKAANASRRQQDAINAQVAAAISSGPSAPSVAPTLLEESKAATTEAMSTASANAQRQQMLRKGMMSLFTRYSDNAGRANAAAPNLAAKASKLGG